MSSSACSPFDVGDARAPDADCLALTAVHQGVERWLLFLRDGVLARGLPGLLQPLEVGTLGAGVVLAPTLETSLDLDHAPVD